MTHMMVKAMVGVSAWYSKDVRYVELKELETGIAFSETVYNGTRMSPAEARALAKELYRLARRVNNRNALKMPDKEPATA